MVITNLESRNGHSELCYIRDDDCYYTDQGVLSTIYQFGISYFCVINVCQDNNIVMLVQIQSNLMLTKFLYKGYDSVLYSDHFHCQYGLISCYLNLRESSFKHHLCFDATYIVSTVWYFSPHLIVVGRGTWEVNLFFKS